MPSAEENSNVSKTMPLRTAPGVQPSDPASQAEEMRLEKQNFSILITYLRNFVGALRERQEKRLNPLLPDGEEGIVMRSANTIESQLSASNQNLATIDSEIVKLILALNKFGTARGRAGVTEDAENLEKVKAFLGKIEQGCQFAMIKSMKDSPEVKQVVKSLGTLFTAVQRNRIQAQKMLEGINRFRRQG